MVLYRQYLVKAPFLSLPYALHLPNFAANLLSIVSIIFQLNCRVIFYSLFLQNLATGRMIGCDCLRDGLYYLDSQPQTQGRLTQVYHTFEQMTLQLELGFGIRDQSILLFCYYNACFLLYFCIILFLSFRVKLVNFLNTIVCLSPNINKSANAFVLVHNDVWGRSQVVSLSSQRQFVSFIGNFSRTT